MADPSRSNDPPRYENIIDQGPDGQQPPEKSHISAARSSGGHAIVDRLVAVRSTHIRSIVDDQIYPLIEQRASEGLSKTTIALIPCDVVVGTIAGSEPDPAASTGPEIVGLAEDDDNREGVMEVRLRGPLDRSHFWRQADVVKELHVVLRDRLSSSSRQLDELLPPPLRERPTETDPVESARGKKRGFFTSRKSSATIIAAVQKEEAPETVGRMVEVKVDLEEICLRTVSDFGLYETISRPVVVVRVDARC